MKRPHELVIIADDLTGANDSGIQLAKKGRCAKVFFNAEDAIEHGRMSQSLIQTLGHSLPPSPTIASHR
ncbi:four-carbon acid sugar kinase family protein [Geomicrobium sp. JCM 19055]|uniref:four-carbon acid sugar kinase family protein n=1 Tax=Geomicrobium sp. JCM 19055 TaxID=1460649 RepID=UPI000694AC6E|nr:four-carbon acid sugar kinase family protein [Geomicrobium sp. JCM 19055]